MSIRCPRISHEFQKCRYFFFKKLAVFYLSLSFANISGGAARHEKVSPKRWRILAFADAIWFLSLQVFATDQPRSRAFKKTFAPVATN